MDSNNEEPPPIEPVRPKPVLKNQTPVIISQVTSNVLLYLEKYGWFLIFGVVVAAIIWTKLEPHWRKWRKKREERAREESADPVTLTKCQEALEMSRRRMQESIDAKAAAHAEKMKELEEQKRQEKIDDWERHQQGRGYRSKTKKDMDNKNDAENKAKTKKSRRLRNSDYNPLTGDSSGSSFRPASRRNTGGG